MVLGTDLTGKMAVVTGAGGILCGMFARTLARAGAAVALLDINLEAAEETARDIREAGGMAAAYGVDVMDKEMLESVHARVLARLGPCDILINGAGGNQARANTSKEYFEMGDIEADVATFFDMEYKGVQGVLDLNFLGGFLTCQVFAIAPGFFVTRQNEGLLYEEDGKPAARTAKVLAATPMGRFGRPEELNGALMFLLNNEAAGFITGIILPVDGGFSAYSGV